jgi:hypothetical protein
VRSFSTILIEFLDQRDKINSDYYDNRAITERYEASTNLDHLGAELDEIINTLSSDVADALALHFQTGKE